MGMNFFVVVVVVVVDVVVKVIGGTWSWPRGGREGGRGWGLTRGCYGIDWHVGMNFFGKRCRHDNYDIKR